jgi:hypothetical protein
VEQRTSLIKSEVANGDGILGIFKVPGKGSRTEDRSTARNEGLLVVGRELLVYVVLGHGLIQLRLIPFWITAWMGTPGEKDWMKAVLCSLCSRPKGVKPVTSTGSRVPACASSPERRVKSGSGRNNSAGSPSSGGPSYVPASRFTHGLD